MGASVGICASLNPRCPRPRSPVFNRSTKKNCYPCSFFALYLSVHLCKGHVLPARDSQVYSHSLYLIKCMKTASFTPTEGRFIDCHVSIIGTGERFHTGLVHTGILMHTSVHPMYPRAGSPIHVSWNALAARTQSLLPLWNHFLYFSIIYNTVFLSASLGS